VRVTRFDPGSDLSIVKAHVWGPRGKLPASLAVDTGSAHTVVAAGLIDTPGYSPRQGEAITMVCTSVGKERRFNVELRLAEGRLLVDRIAAASG
jgi:hypothetical protein